MAVDHEAPEENEIVAAARGAKAASHGRQVEAERARARRWQLGTLGLGVGLGSAAIAAAVLYATRSRDEGEQ